MPPAHRAEPPSGELRRRVTKSRNESRTRYGSNAAQRWECSHHHARKRNRDLDSADSVRPLLETIFLRVNRFGQAVCQSTPSFTAGIRTLPLYLWGLSFPLTTPFFSSVQISRPRPQSRAIGLHVQVRPFIAWLLFQASLTAAAGSYRRHGRRSRRGIFRIGNYQIAQRELLYLPA